jgi:hypothetical protein
MNSYQDVVNSLIAQHWFSPDWKAFAKRVLNIKVRRI